MEHNAYLLRLVAAGCRRENIGQSVTQWEKQTMGTSSNTVDNIILRVRFLPNYSRYKAGKYIAASKAVVSIFNGEWIQSFYEGGWGGG